MATQLARSFEYLYYLRFSLSLWLFPLAFALLDSGWLPLSTTTHSRGIFVPEYWSGFLCVEFFLVSTACVSLITARIVVLNGIARYPEHCPDCVTPLLEQHDMPCAEANRDLNRAPRWLFGVLAGPTFCAEIWAFTLALIPSLLTNVYVILNGVSEGVRLHDILIGIAAGFFIACLFWYFINAWYYLAYRCPVQPAAGESLKLGRNAARTILLPRRCFGLQYPGAGVLVGNPCSLEDIDTSLRASAFAKRISQLLTLADRRFGLPGYFYEDGRLYEDGQVFMYEGQLFSIIAAIGFIALFWILCPLTAPRYTRWCLGAFMALFLGFAWAIRIVLTGKCAGHERLVRRWQFWLSWIGGVFCLGILILWLISSPDRFPTLASILLMAIVLGWVFAGMAFFLDRYRFPVLTFCLLLIFVPRVFHLYDVGGFEEHYVSTVQRSANATSLPTPAEIISQRLKANPDDAYPYVIVTSTGGGLHASAWTARVLRQLYETLPQNFSSHILLLSTVSGGSTGLSYYLQAIHANPTHPDLDHMVVAAQCSSLEAVGWGLVYYDFARVLLPGSPWVIHPSRGDNDLDTSPLGKDRTWGLRRGFVRNANDPYCFDSAKTLSSQDTDLPQPSLNNWPRKEPWYQRIFHDPTDTDTASQLTIGELPAIDERIGGHSFPAFTMNTTTVEGGDRLLLANYRLPAYRVGTIEGMAAESFLDVFCRNPWPDLPLASAAQLSATFPYVSSAARIPENYASQSVHFVDGGYYDNDGTSSVIEFLRYALEAPASTPTSVSLRQDANSQEHVREELGASHLRILLLEIRNSEDTDEPTYAVRPKVLNPGQHDNPDPRPAGLLQQLGFPLEGFWNAGHGSVTGRNRNSLDLLRNALQDRLDLHQIIFDDETTPQTRFGLQAASDPLSWSLTPRERAEIRRSADPNLDPKHRLTPCYKSAVSWFIDFQTNWRTSHGNPEPTRCDLEPH